MLLRLVRRCCLFLKLIAFDMKKLILLIFVILFTSCVGSKKTTKKDKVTKITELTDRKKDSATNTVVNSKIDDQFSIPVATADSLVNQSIKKALKDFNFKKSSGSNATSVRFDYEKMAFIVSNLIGETKSTDTTVNTDTNTEKSFEEEVTENTKKIIRIIPWWLWAIGAFFLLPKILNIVGIFYPPAGMFLNRNKS